MIHDEVMGSRIRRTVSNVSHADIIIDLEQKKMLTLDHSKKMAVFIELGGLDDLKNYIELVRNVVMRIEDNPKFEVETLGLQEIDEQTYAVFFAESNKESITIWANPETGLPLRIEQKTPNMTILCDNMEFDVPFDEARFSMQIPDGYVVQNSGIDLKGGNEEAFIESLRIWAEVIEDDRFPESIDLKDVVKVGMKFDKGMKRINLTEQEQIELATRWGQGLLFLRFFKGQGKWHYAGKGVELGDSNAPVFWYRPKGSPTWRVIYGDLHVEDVGAEDLPN